MSIEENSKLEINEKDQSISENQDAQVKVITQDYYLHSDDGYLFTESDECSFIKGYN